MRADAPHKVILAGSYVVLGGAPATVVAAGPRLAVRVRNGPVRPVADPVLAAAIVETGLPDPGMALASGSRATAGWGLGRSAASAAAAVALLRAAAGLPWDAGSVFPQAWSSHRRAQGGQGSGADVAACCYGGVVVVTPGDAGTLPAVREATWPLDVRLILARSGTKADSRVLVARWRSLPPGRARDETVRLDRAAVAVAEAVRQGGPGAFLDALHECSVAEHHWTRATGIPLVTPFQSGVERAVRGAVPPGLAVVKAVGAGGGDSVGILVDRKAMEAVRSTLGRNGIETRVPVLARHGVRVTLAP